MALGNPEGIRIKTSSLFTRILASDSSIATQASSFNKPKMRSA